MYILLIKITQQRDRRPRLPALISLLPNEDSPLMRTDEGVRPYFVASFPNQYPVRHIPSKEGLGEAFTLPVVQGALHSPLLSARGRG